MRSVGEVGLQKAKSAEGYRDVIGSMLEEANHLTRLVENLLTIARADAGQIPLRKTDFTASQLVRECGTLFEAVLDESRQRLNVEIAQDSSIHGDWILLRQALVNIVHNAMKYTPEGEAIALRVRYEDGCAVFEVQDRGPGIPAEDLAKIFDRFYRVDESRSREAGGTGLGLSIAQWNVEMHGGTIAASSTVGEGATFRVTLPAERYDLPPDAAPATAAVFAN
jgi:signal transduction histidine kinase